MKKILLSVLVLMLAFPLGLQAEDAKPENTFPLATDHLPMVSENYILMDVKTGIIVAGQNIDKKVHPASITKVFTSIAGLEMLEDTDLNNTLEVPQSIFPIDKEASIAQFNPGDVFTYDDVFYGLALPSGADAANALSYDLTGSAEGLAENMNDLAKRIGMTDTHFVNTTGLDDVNHTTTVKDLAKGVSYALQNEDFRRYYTTTYHTSGKTRMHPNGIEWLDRTLVNAEALNYTQIIGAKSGFTDLAGRSVSLLIESQGNEYIYVSTNAPESYPNNITVVDAMKIVREMEENYTRTELFVKDTPIEQHSVFGLKDPISVQFNHTELYYLPKTQSVDKITYVVEGLPKYALKGIKKGTELGTLNIMHEEDVLYSAPIIANEAIGLSLVMILIIGGVVLLAAIIIITLLAMIYFALVRRRNRSRRRKAVRR